MEYEDYPKHIRQHWKNIEDDWDKAFDLRGSRRYKARNNVRDYFCGKLDGFEIRNENDRKHFKKELLEAKWKSEESQRAQYCCAKLEEEREKFYKIRDKLFHETLALKEEIKALKEKNAHLQAQIRCMEAPTPV